MSDLIRFRTFDNATSAAGFLGTYEIGQLSLGWILDINFEVNKDIRFNWPYASINPKGRGLRIPYPVLHSEWDELKKIFKQHQIPIPDYVESSAQKALHNAEIRFELSHATHLEEAPRIPGFKKDLFPFQPVGVNYAESLGWRAVIGDDMGLGKTPVGLACALSSGAKRVIVVTRSVAIPAWHRAVHLFTDYPARVASGAAPVSLLKSGRIPKMTTEDNAQEYVPLNIRNPKLTKKELEAGKVAPTFDLDLLRKTLAFGTNLFDEGVFILNYDILPQWQETLMAWNPDMFILDEFHAIKEIESQRGAAAHSMMSNIEKVIGLTGTLLPNRPMEMFHMMNSMHPGHWGEVFPFARKFCDAKQIVVGANWEKTDEKIPCKCRGKDKGCKHCYGKGWKFKMKYLGEKKAWDFSGASNTKELYRRLRGYGMVRRMKDDVLNMMPPQFDTIPIEASKHYRDVESGILRLVDGQFNPVEKKSDETKMHELFAAAALDKIEWSKLWINDFLEDTDESLVIFFHHNAVGDALVEWLTEKKVDFVSLYGNRKDIAGDIRFQNTPSCRIALCSYGVAREAVTLTKSSYMLGLEYAWVPGWMEQARDRIRRIGQERVCNYYFPVIRNSVEYNIVEGMLQKQDILSIINQGKILRGIDINMKKVKSDDALALEA